MRKEHRINEWEEKQVIQTRLSWRQFSMHGTTESNSQLDNNKSEWMKDIKLKKPTSNNLFDFISALAYYYDFYDSPPL